MCHIKHFAYSFSQQVCCSSLPYFFCWNSLVTALYWWKNIDHLTNRFGYIGRRIYFKCSFSHSKLMISVISKPNKTWHFRIKMFKILICCNHSISSIITYQLNSFISYIFNFMPLLKCIIVQFSDWWKAKIEAIQANSTHIFVKQNGKDDLFQYQCLVFTTNIWII